MEAKKLGHLLVCSKGDRQAVTLRDLTFWDNPDIFNGKFLDKKYAINVYKEWIEECKRIIPSDQLLIFNVKDGWEPLCKFLNKEIPKEYIDKGFPRSNDTNKMLETLKYRKRKNIIGYGIIITCIVVGGIISAKIIKKMKRK